MSLAGILTDLVPDLDVKRRWLVERNWWGNILYLFGRHVKQGEHVSIGRSTRTNQSPRVRRPGRIFQRPFPDIEVEERVVCGGASAVLIDQGATADMLVVGSRGLGGFKGLLLGSVSHQVVTHAPCPTVIVPHRDEQPAANYTTLRSIVVGVDGSPNSIAALRWAAHRVHKSETVLRAVYGWQTPPTAVAPIGTGIPDIFIKEAAEALAGFIAAAELPDDVHAVPVSREGSPAKVLLMEGRQADLLVVGARGHEGFIGLLLGSVATAVAHHAPCPVAVIPVM